jgi:heme exporter protein CcmD
VIAEHAQYITWSYVGAALVTVALIAYVIWDSRRVKARLAALEKAGIRRRSAGTDS